jgi:predicted nuclease of restriction endonuclease-like (RecB) superfamily
VRVSKHELAFYRDLLGDIKIRVRQGQHRAALSANAEMIAMYWDIGRMIAARQKEKGWGAGVIPRLAVDLKNELPEQKGFSERNLGHMIRFAREYRQPPILQQSAAKLGTAGQMRAQSAPQIAQEPFVQQPAAQLALPPKIIFGLPWFHHVIVIDLKKGEFKPEYAGKMNFYCSAVDDLLRREHDAPTIGLILCQTKDRIFAEYALRDIHKPIGLAEYELTRALPRELASSLPSIEQLEAELGKEEAP